MSVWVAPRTHQVLFRRTQMQQALRNSSVLTLSRIFRSHDSVALKQSPVFALLLLPFSFISLWCHCRDSPQNPTKVLLTSEDCAASPGRTSSCALVVASSSLRFQLLSLKESPRPVGELPALRAWSGVQLCSLFELFGRLLPPFHPPTRHQCCINTFQRLVQFGWNWRGGFHMGALLAKYCIKLTSHILDAIFGGCKLLIQLL